MFRIGAEFLLAVTAIVTVTSVHGSEPAILVEGGTLIDGRGGPARPNPGILIREGRFAVIGDVGALPAGTERISAEGKWVLPAMFELHAHITFYLAGPREWEDDVVNAIRAERFLERYQQIGVTTVRDLASRNQVGYSLKRAQRAGLLGGADYYVAGPLITTTGGHPTEIQPLLPSLWAVEANGPWEFRERVRQAVKLGADLIKLTPPFTPEELGAAVAEAHYWKRRVTVQVSGAQDLSGVSGRVAVEAGVDGIEHLYPYGGEEVVRQIAVKGIYVVPTLGYHLRELAGQYTHKPDWLERHLGHTRERMMKQFRQMVEAGVKFGVGVDSNAVDLPIIDKLYLQELQALAGAGLSAMRVIQSATLHSAEAMGLGDDAGSIEVGKRADVIVVDGDPLKGFESMVAPRLVFQWGKIVHRRPSGTGL